MALANMGLALLFILFQTGACSFIPTETDIYLESSTKGLEILLGDTAEVNFFLKNKDVSESVTIFFQVDNDGIIEPIPQQEIDESNNVNVTIKPIKAGHVVITTNTSDPNIRTERTGYVRVDVMKSLELETVSTVVGWIYFVAWSVSFYPQIYDNFKRRSVIGLNFDFLSLNVIGFTVYGVFNIGLYWIPSIQDEYFELHPQGVNPVQGNDVFFTLHAVLACIVTIIQCFFYQRGNQRVSRVCTGIIIIFVLFLGSSLICTLASQLTWLQFLYFCSYVKLCITLIKYVPQAYMNYSRKSTAGWSIGNILLDFTGGSLSIVQMLIISYNNDDWGAIFGDPTKFGLGFFSILFDILFIVQHYFLYRDSLPHQELDGEQHMGEENSSYQSSPIQSEQTSHHVDHVIYH